MPIRRSRDKDYVRTFTRNVRICSIERKVYMFIEPKTLIVVYKDELIFDKKR